MSGYKSFNLHTGTCLLTGILISFQIQNAQ